MFSFALLYPAFPTFSLRIVGGLRRKRLARVPKNAARSRQSRWALEGGAVSVPEGWTDARRATGAAGLRMDSVESTKFSRT